MSGGSPARRERMMRSCVMLKVLTITAARPGGSFPRWSRPGASIGRAASRRARPGGSGSRGDFRRRDRRRRGSCMRRAVAGNLAADRERDDAVGAERAGDVDRHRIDDGAVKQPAPADAAPAGKRRAARRTRASPRQSDRSSARFRGRCRSQWRRRRSGSASPRSAARPSRLRAARAADLRRSGRRH